MKWARRLMILGYDYVLLYEERRVRMYVLTTTAPRPNNVELLMIRRMYPINVVAFHVSFRLFV